MTSPTGEYGTQVDKRVCLRDPCLYPSKTKHHVHPVYPRHSELLESIWKCVICQWLYVKMMWMGERESQRTNEQGWGEKSSVCTALFTYSLAEVSRTNNKMLSLFYFILWPLEIPKWFFFREKLRPHLSFYTTGWNFFLWSKITQLRVQHTVYV